MSKTKTIITYALVSQELVERRILLIRGKKVMLDADLASLYQVSTKTLNQAVKRNIQRCPSDFMFRLIQKEKNEVVTNCDHLRLMKFSSTLPYAFTDLGIAMLSSILASERAVQVNIQIMRAFSQMKEMISRNKALKERIDEMEQKYDSQFKVVFDAIREILEPPKSKRKKPIGFHVKH